jgi:hypothetical protein
LLDLQFLTIRDIYKLDTSLKKRGCQLRQPHNQQVRLESWIYCVATNSRPLYVQFNEAMSQLETVEAYNLPLNITQVCGKEVNRPLKVA